MTRHLPFSATFAATIHPYRIKSHWWYRYQSEYPALCRFARRGRTPAAAERRMKHDVAISVTYGRRSWGQFWREMIA